MQLRKCGSAAVIADSLRLSKLRYEVYGDPSVACSLPSRKARGFPQRLRQRRQSDLTVRLLTFALSLSTARLVLWRSTFLLLLLMARCTLSMPWVAAVVLMYFNTRLRRLTLLPASISWVPRLLHCSWLRL